SSSANSGPCRCSERRVASRWRPEERRPPYKVPAASGVGWSTQRVGHHRAGTARFSWIAHHTRGPTRRLPARALLPGLTTACFVTVYAGTPLQSALLHPSDGPAAEAEQFSMEARVDELQGRLEQLSLQRIQDLAGGEGMARRLQNLLDLLP